MASGHMNCINRPNTWPHRPAAQREHSPCQPDSGDGPFNKGDEIVGQHVAFGTAEARESVTLRKIRAKPVRAGVLR
jgi:hypothetical protein